MNIKIFSTGRDSIFNTHNLLATTFVSENFSFEDIELQEGKNYFWLTYDINYYVQTLNLMDAKCDNIQIYNHTIVPENNDPEEAVVIVDRYPYFYIPPQPYSDSVIYVNDGAERNMDGDYIVRVEVSQNNINSIKIKAFWYPSSDDIYTYYYGINLNINIYENNNWETIDSNFKNRTSPRTSPNLDRINELFKDYSFQEPLTDTVYIRLSLIDLISNTDRMTGFYGCADCGTGNVDDRDFDNVEIRIFPPILNQFSFSVVDYYICENDSISIAGKYQSENGLYLDSTTSVFGGDSIVFYRLYSLPSVHSITEYSICMGDSILIDNIWYNQNISITDTLISVSGCDSISGIIVNVLTPEERTQEVSICEGEYFNTYSEQGTYYDTIQSSMGCDSIITTYLNIVPLFSEKDTIISICQGDSILGYSTSGIYRDTIIDDFCPYTQVLHLEVNPKYFLDTSIYICENISIPGSGIYTESFKTNKGCDSIIRTTLVTNFKHFVSESIIINESENYRGYTSTGTYVDTLVSSYGCDSIVILLLTVNECEDTQEHTLTDNSILIYPSIVNDYISVELIGILPSNFNILIYNELGVLVYFNNHIINKKNKIDVSKYNPGIYLIEISNNNKRIIYRKKIVKRW